MVSFHKIMISVVLMTGVIAGFMAFYSEGSTLYSQTDYNNTNLLAIKNQLSVMQTISNQTKTAVEDITEPDNLLDIFGGMFRLAWGAVKTAGQSYDVLFTIIIHGTDSLPVSEDYTSIIIAVLTTSVLIIIFVAIMLHVFTKSDRT